jgi:hypothetical protein
VSELNRFPDSTFDRIGAYLPAEQRASYFRYVAHLRTLNPKDELLILAEGMAVFTCISRQVPEALAGERDKLIAEFARLVAKHESATTNATADVRTLFTAHQKLLEQNIATWQNKEQQTAHSLDRIAKRFEESANGCAVRLQSACGEFQAATKEHHAAAQSAQNWVMRVSIETRLWPYFGCATGGSLLTILIMYFLKK